MKVFISILLLSLFACSSNNPNWTHFRGSQLNGKALDQEIPTKWSPENTVWKTALPGTGWSSPVVLGNQVWLTTAENDGHDLYALQVDLNSGELVQEIMLYQPDTVFRKHAVNSYATPTPCIEEGFVYIHFGSYGTACLDTDTGEKIWERTDLRCEHVQGPGSCPILHKNKLILHYEGKDVQYIVALDKSTGETLWKTYRPKEIYDEILPIGKKAYITPIVIDINGKDVLISNGSGACIAYDVETGIEVWRVVQGEDSTIASPVEEDGVIFIYTGYTETDDGDRSTDLLAIDSRGQGDVTKSHVLWRMDTPILQLLTPIVHEGKIYTIDTKSNIMCVDAKDGSVLYKERVNGKYNASPVLVGDKLVYCATNGNVLVVEKGNELNILAENKLDGQIWASPAVVNNKILIRTSNYLYCIGEK